MEVLDRLQAPDGDERGVRDTAVLIRREAKTRLAARLVDLGEPEAAVAARQRLLNQGRLETNPQMEDLEQFQLVHLVFYLGQHGYIDLALARARAIDEAYWRAEALAGLTPHLPEAAPVVDHEGRLLALCTIGPVGIELVTLSALPTVPAATAAESSPVLSEPAPVESVPETAPPPTTAATPATDPATTTTTSATTTTVAELTPTTSLP